tara:strand:- start:583 stop:972 length:390 start_codon:yes stop_codon:yes gene_type:complete
MVFPRRGWIQVLPGLHWHLVGSWFSCGLERADLGFDDLAVLLLGEFKIVMELEAEEKSGTHSKESRESEVVFGSDPAFPVFHFREVAGDNSGGGGDILLAERRVFDDFTKGLRKRIEERDCSCFHGFFG